MKQLAVMIFLSFLIPIPAYAYLDPGTGSMLLSALIGIFATAFFAIKAIYYKLAAFFLSLFGIKIEKNEQDLVFYSEGGNYWTTFKPILIALDKMEVEAVYLTSSSEDPGLSYCFSHIKTRYIGKGNKAYAYLNMLEAQVCVMTTPGLDVLQIKRSKGVKHYAYVFHAATDAGLYKLFSFDYFDSIYYSGAHQKKSLQYFEKLRGTSQKEIIEGGCPYMDELSTRIDMNEAKGCKKELTTILIAPTWGNNGLLKRFGSTIIKPLLDEQYQVVVRPHPQSYISEKDMINSLEKELKEYSNLSWDRSADNFNALYNSDIMISDLSGVIFDYAFVFEKPVITIELEVDLLGTDGKYLPYCLWELTMLDKIGKNIKLSELEQLSSVISEFTSQQEQFHRQLIKLRDKHLLNYGRSGEIIAKSLSNRLE